MPWLLDTSESLSKNPYRAQLRSLRSLLEPGPSAQSAISRRGSTVGHTQKSSTFAAMSAWWVLLICTPLCSASGRSTCFVSSFSSIGRDSTGAWVMVSTWSIVSNRSSLQSFGSECWVWEVNVVNLLELEAPFSYVQGEPKSREKDGMFPGTSERSCAISQRKAEPDCSARQKG